MIKPINISLLFVILTFMSSCVEESREDIATHEQIGQLSFTTYNDTGCETKTYLDGFNVRWHADDIIGIHDRLTSGVDTKYNRQFEVKSVNPDGSAIFIGTATTGQSIYYATYPYDAKNYVTTEGKMRIGFISNQTASSPGTFDKTFNSAAAVLKDGVFRFKNLGGLLKFTLTEENVSKVTLKANDGQTVGGVYYIYFDSEGNIDPSRTTMPSNGSRPTMTLSPSGRSTFASGDYYFVLTPRTYKGGMNISFTLSDGSVMTANCKDDIIVERSKITTIGRFETGPDPLKDETLTIMSALDMNKGTAELNSHVKTLDRSTLSPIGGTYVKLSESTTKESKPVYPRLIKTDAGDYLMFYHAGVTTSSGGTSWAGNECQYMRSTDLVNWTWEKKLFSVFAITDCEGKANKRAYAGANMIKLANGDILAVASTRAVSNYRDRNADNGLAIRISKDNGHTWGEEQIVYVGTNWEPMPIILPSGRIQIYYTDSKKLTEGAFGSGKEVISTGSSYIWSDDNGKTWNGNSNNAAEHSLAFAQVRYQYESLLIMTDQMPAVIALNNSTKLAAAAESFIGGASYNTYISMAYSDENGNWGTPDSRGVLPKDRTNNFTLGCAPYLVQFPSGETVLAYNRSNVFYMRQGNEQARNFGDEIKIFNGSSTDGQGFWGTLYCIDTHHMAASIGGSQNVIQIGQFYLNHSIKASTHTVTIDGNNTDWKETDEALYVCSLEDAKASLRCSRNDDFIYFIFDVEDKTISGEDYVSLYLSDATSNTLSSSSICITASYKGLKTFSQYNNGKWTEISGNAVVSSRYNETAGNNGYVVEIAIPTSALPVSSGKILVNAALHDNNKDASIIQTSGTSTSKWMIINNL